MAIEYGGGECQICGYKKSIRALTFHHKKSGEKDFGLSERVELDKCILLCANCHAEVHDGLINVPKKKPTRKVG